MPRDLIDDLEAASLDADFMEWLKQHLPDWRNHRTGEVVRLHRAYRSQPMPAIGTYQKDKPTLPGWYFCYNPIDHSEFVCRVDHGESSGLVCSWMTAPGQSGSMPEAEWADTTLWCGPLPAPNGRT